MIEIYLRAKNNCAFPLQVRMNFHSSWLECVPEPGPDQTWEHLFLLCAPRILPVLAANSLPQQPSRILSFLPLYVLRCNVYCTFFFSGFCFRNAPKDFSIAFLKQTTFYTSCEAEVFYCEFFKFQKLFLEFFVHRKRKFEVVAQQAMKFWVFLKNVDSDVRPLLRCAIAHSGRVVVFVQSCSWLFQHAETWSFFVCQVWNLLSLEAWSAGLLQNCFSLKYL